MEIAIDFNKKLQFRENFSVVYATESVWKSYMGRVNRQDFIKNICLRVYF